MRKCIIDEAAKAFGGTRILAIISNSAGSSDDKNYEEADAIEKSMDLKVIKHKYKKPNVHKDIMDHFNCIEEEKVAIIGDRILADIVMGNRFGFFTIYVDPIEPKKENLMVKMIRKFENQAIPLILPRDKKPIEHSLVKEIAELKKNWVKFNQYFKLISSR